MSGSREGATALQVGRIGLIGAIIGALIGGIGSFSGAYLTYRQQRDIHVEDTKRAAYVKLAEAAQGYRIAIARLEEIASQKNQEAYAKNLKELTSEGGAELDLYSASIVVNIIGEESVRKSASTMIAALYSHQRFPASVDKFDRNRVFKALSEGQIALDAFQSIARRDMQQD